jgi:hypothetical protein
MGAAVVASILARALIPAADPTTTEYVLTNGNDASSYIQRYELFVIATFAAAFVQWVCSAAVMVGIRWILISYPSNPLVWLNVAVSRLPSLFAVFMLASGAFLVAGVLVGVQLHTIYSDIANPDTDLLDPVSISLRFAAVRYETHALWAFALIVVPLSIILAAVVMLEDLRPARAIALMTATCFSQPQLKHLVSLWGVIVAIFGAGSILASAGASALSSAHVASWAWTLPRALIEAAVFASIAVVVALAWMSGYIGPRSSTATGPLPDMK